MECPHDAQLFDTDSNSTQAILRKLAHFQRWYQPIHGYVCVLICVFGIFTNFVHVAVLSRPNMRNSAVNCILTAVAVCDIGTMASYLIYIIHFVLRRNNLCTPTFTYSWLQFLLWHVVLSITLHTTSLWLAVAMAFIRRMTLRVTALNRYSGTFEEIIENNFQSMATTGLCMETMLHNIRPRFPIVHPKHISS
ncbi:hypothetical protein CAEBREN_06466 [Caenorhabditis brenneri]|uniref:G-protein coupled receptors family 1 profile domain-containing protein n=1 Tax=Caenorhabditis brenneri TaxID=135651 RepID=G0PN77_CAEBE|nr:hypothetical protein CAEBREN_06466 [Caenorhabditis brenneri]